MDRYHSFILRLTTAFTVVGISFMVGVMLVIVANIISRAFDKAILGTYELAQLMLAVTVGCALAYCALMQSHVIVSIVLTRLRHPVRKVLAVITTFFSLVLWILVAWQGAKFAMEQLSVREITFIMEWPVYPSRFIFLIGVILLCLLLFGDLVKALRESVRNEPN